MSGRINLHIGSWIFHSQIIFYKTVSNNSRTSGPYAAAAEPSAILNTQAIKSSSIDTDYRLLSGNTNQDSYNWPMSRCNQHILA